MAFSPDAHTLAVTQANEAVVLWDISDPDEPKRRSPLTLAGKQVKALGTAISPDGKLMAVSQEDRSMGVWDISRLSSPRLLGRTQGLFGGFIDQLSFSADGRHMVTSAYDDQDPPADMVWDLTDPYRPHASLLASNANMAVASPKGTTAAVVNGSGKTTLWDIAQPDKPRAVTPPLTDHTAGVRTVAFSPDGTMMATGGDDRQIILYDVSHPDSPHAYATLQGHGAPVTSLTFSPDGRRLISTSGKQTLVWTTHPPSAPQVLPDIPSDASRVVLSPDRRLLLLTNGLGGAVWNLGRDGHGTRRADLPEGLEISAAAFSRDDHLLLVLNTLDIRRSIIDVYDLRNGSVRLVSSTRREMTTDEDTMVLSPDGSTLALPDGEHQINLWSLADPRHPREVWPLTGQHSRLSMLQFSPDSRHLMAVGSDGTLTCWAIDTGALTHFGRIARELPSPLYDDFGKRNTYSDVFAIPLGHERFATMQGVSDQIRSDQIWSWSPLQGFAEVTSAKPELSDAYPGPGATSADGHLAISQGPNTKVQVWDVRDFEHPNLLSNFAANAEDDQIGPAALAEDGRLLVMGTQENVKVRDLTPLKRIVDSPAAVACRLADGGLTRAEWDQYLPRDPYVADCPTSKGSGS